MNMTMTFYTLLIFFNTILWDALLFIRISMILLSIFWLLMLNLHLDFINDYIFMNDGYNGQTNTNQGNTGQNIGNSGQDPSGPEQNSYGLPSFNSEEDKNKWINDHMHDKLIRHRLSCAYNVPYNTRMGDNFTPQEHEYVCDKVQKYVETDPNTNYRFWVKGNFPERRYIGQISVAFVQTIFPKW